MNTEKKEFKRIVIYMTPVFERVTILTTFFFLTVLSVIGVFMLEDHRGKSVVVFLLMLIFDLLFCIDTFRSYIALDPKKGLLTVREFFGTKKEEFDLSTVCRIEISDGVVGFDENAFTVDIVGKGYTQKIDSWSTYPGLRSAMFCARRRQRKRLTLFADRCNAYLENRIQ